MRRSSRWWCPRRTRAPARGRSGRGSRRAASAVTSSRSAWPALDLDPLAVRGHRVALEGDLDRPSDSVVEPSCRRRRSSSSPHAVRPAPTAESSHRGSTRSGSTHRSGRSLLHADEHPSGARLCQNPTLDKPSGTLPRGGRATTKGDAMSERLRPRDLAFLADGVRRRRRCTTRRSRSSTRATSGFDYARLVRADRGPDLVRARATASGSSPCRAGSPTRSGSTTTTSTSATTYAAPRCRARARSTSCASWSPGSCPGRSTGSRPLWEVYFVEGLADGRVALLSKSHQALVDGVETVDLGQVLLDSQPGAARARAPTTGGRGAAVAGRAWWPAPSRDSRDRARHRRRHGAQRRPGRVLRAAGAAPDRVGARRRRAAPTAAQSRSRRSAAPLSQQRRVVTVRTDLADYRKVREAHGGTVNDVILATVTGALRAWLMTRGESMARRSARCGRWCRCRSSTTSSRPPRSAARSPRTSSTCRSARPARWSGCTRCPTRSRRTRRPAAASRPTGWPGIAGFAPTTFHALGSRVAADELRRGFQLCVTNVPGPQSPLYAAGARMLATYPVPPAAAGPRAGDRRDVVRRRRLLRHHRRPRPAARRRPARPVPARGARRAASTPPPAAGRGRRAAARRRKPTETES